MLILPPKNEKLFNSEQVHDQTERQMSQYIQKRHFGGRKAGLTEAWFSVLHWWCCYGNRCQHPYGGHGVLKIVSCWTEPPRGPFASLTVVNSIEKKTTTHKCKCRVSGRKVMETYCGEAFGWIVVRGCCLRCECNVVSDSAWRLLNLCGCSSAPRHSYVYLHLRGCSWTTLLAKTSLEHQLLLR